MKALSILNKVAILVLLLWGGTFIYFYASGRIEKHIDVNFRTWALVAGLGLCVVGLFNLATGRRQVACGHDHGHGDEGGCGHDHSHDHDHHHSHAKGGCGHDHSHDHDHDHHHSHAEGGCGHDHSHDHDHDHDHHHSHAEGGCGHDHSHDHAADSHDHEHDHDHDHGQTPSGLLAAILILTVPLLMAAHYSEDRFSSGYIAKWGKIERQIYQMRIAERREAARKNQPAAASVSAAATAKGAASTPPTAMADAATTPDSSTAADTPPSGAGATTAADQPPTAEAAEPANAEGGAEWGAFTMADLERMVPKNEAGNFLLDVPQIFYTAGDDELMKVMEGIPVEASAQVMEETMNNPNGTRLKLFRLFVECCAADARPLSIPIEFGKTPPKYEEMGWVKVIGKIHYADEDGQIVPLIQVQSMESIPEPMDMMLY